MKTIRYPRLAGARRARTSLLALGIAFAVSLPGCRSEGADAGPASATKDRPEAQAPVILLVGVDGLEWDVVLPLIREGRMPNLEKLMARGTYGKLATYAPAKSPVIWTTIATGKVPEKHGIVDFFKDPDSKPPTFFTSRDRKTKAFWNILSDAGRRVVVVGWWNTFPAEAINGLIVAQTNTMSGIQRRRLLKGGLVFGTEGQVHPDTRQNEMLRILLEVDAELPRLIDRIFGKIRAVSFGPNQLNWEQSCWAFRADETYRRVALKLESEGPLPDCLAVYFGVPDVVGHRFWRFHEPAVFEYPPPAAQQQRFGHVIRDAYARFDSTLGELVAAFPPYATIFVVSDHGMHATHRDKRFDVVQEWGGIHLESGAHEDGPPGVLVVAGPQIKKTHLAKSIRNLAKEDIPQIASVVDITPTILAILDVPVGRDMDGSVLKHVLTPAFAETLDVKYVATHDSAQWLATRDVPQREIPGAKERIEQLRALGYLGGPDEEDEAAPKGESQSAKRTTTQPRPD